MHAGSGATREVRRDGRDHVAVGGIATLPALNVKNFSVANANIDVRLTPDGKKFIIAGKTAGRCDLVLFFRNGTEKILKVNVTPAE